MKKKELIISSIMSILVIGLLLLTACGSKPATEEANGANTVPSEEGEAAGGDTATSEDPVTISVWYLSGPAQDWLADIAVPAFEAEHPNIKVDPVGYPEEEYGLKIETAVAAGQVPDVAILVLFNAPRVVPTGALLDLAPLMEESGWSKSDFCPSIDSRFNVLNDTLYAVPMDTNIWAMMYNKALFADAGLPELTADSYIDYETWLEYAQALTTPSENLEEYVWGSALFWPRWNSMNNYMSSPFFLGDDGRTAIGNSETEDWENYYEYQLAAYEQGLMPESASTATASFIAADLFNQGQIGMIYGSLGQAMAARSAGIDVGLTGQPVITPGWKGNVGSWESSWSIFSGSEHPEEAWEFISFLVEEGALIVAESAGSYANAAMPCLLSAQEAFIEGSGGDPLVQDAITLLGHVVSPPWTVDAWASSTPFEEAWRRMTEDGVDIPTALHDAALQSQDVTDSLWSDWEALTSQ